MVANLVQIFKQCLAAAAQQGPLRQASLQGEACTKLPVACSELPTSHTELPAYTVSAI